MGSSGPEKGVMAIAYGLRDAGFEVIFLGTRHTPEQIASIAIQEDVDVVCLSIFSETPVPLTKSILEIFAEYI